MYCPECGSKNKKGSMFCEECGAKLEVEKESAPKKEKKEKPEEKKKKPNKTNKKKNSSTKEEKKQSEEILKKEEKEEIPIEKRKIKKEKHKKKKIIILASIFLFIIGIGVFFGWKYYDSTRSVGSTWGDTYYYYIRDSKDNNKKKIPNNSKIKFIQVPEVDKPVMLINYKKKNKEYSDVYYIKKDKVNNAVNEEPSEIEFLYNIENKEYNWYVHTTQDKKEYYVPLKDIIDNKEDIKSENSYAYEEGAEISAESENGETISIPKFDSEFIKPEITIEDIKYNEDFSNAELQEVIIGGIENYKPFDKIITDKVKEEIEQEVEEVNQKLEDIEKAKEEAEIKITSNNVQEKIGEHLKWFSGAYLGVMYGWPKVFTYKEVTDNVKIPTAECKDATIYEVVGLNSIKSLTTQLSDYVSKDKFSRFYANGDNFVGYFTEYNNQVYWCNLGIGDGDYINSKNAKVLSSPNGISKVQLQVINSMFDEVRETITVTVTYNKDTKKYLITDWLVKQN